MQNTTGGVINVIAKIMSHVCDALRRLQLVFTRYILSLDN